jgi:hypothetical protein
VRLYRRARTIVLPRLIISGDSPASFAFGAVFRFTVNTGQALAPLELRVVRVLPWPIPGVVGSATVAGGPAFDAPKVFRRMPHLCFDSCANLLPRRLHGEVKLFNQGQP